MPHPARFYPALAGLLILGLMLLGPAEPSVNLCRIARQPAALAERCLAVPHLALAAGAVAIALIALTLSLVLRWQRRRPRAISYESDAGRWVVIGWFLTIAGAVSLLLGLLLIGSGGWPFSQQSRHIQTRTGQLPVHISTVQRRYFANYSGFAETQAVCAGFGEVTIENRSRHRRLALDLCLRIAPRDKDALPPRTAIPGREDLLAIARRGLTPQSMFRNPVELNPRQMQRKELVFVIFFEAPGHLPDRDDALVLEVKDRLTGQAIVMALPAEYRG